MSTTHRITHLIVRLDTGGAETSLLRLIAGTREKLTHHVICFGPPTALGQEIENLGVRVSWLNYRRRGPWVLWQAFRLLRRHPPDILQGWMYYGNVLASFLAWCLRKSAGAKSASAAAKVAWNVRNAIVEPASDSWMIRSAIACTRWCHPDLVIYNSFAGQQAHKAMSLRGRQVVIPNGINLTEFAPDAKIRDQVRSTYHRSSDIWVGVIARWHKGKGIREYLEAVKLLRQHKGAKARFFLAGNGLTLDHPEFAALLKEVGLAPCELDLLGPIKNVAGFLPAVDLLVLPSLREGTPNILLEAMACGVNTVATTVGDAPRIVQSPARQVVPGDVQDLAAKISTAMVETDKNRDARIMQEREFLNSNYSAPMCMQAYCDHYQNLLAPSSHAQTVCMKLFYVVNEARFFISHRLALGLTAIARGDDVWVITAPATGEEELAQYGFKHVSVPLTRSGFTLLSEIAAYRALKQLYRREKPDLVHHVTIKPVIYGSLAARAAEVAAVVNAVPGLGFVFSRRGLRAAGLRMLVNALYRFAFANISMRVIFQNSEDQREFVDHSIVRKEQTILIRGSGVDLKSYIPAPETNGPLVFLLVSRMLREKGVIEFAQAAKLVKRQHPDWRFLLAGDLDPGNPSGVSRQELDALQKESGVQWLGYQADIPKLMAQAHVICLPTFYGEGLPKTLLEASAAQRAMIATDIAGCREVITSGVNGLLVPPRTVEPLAQAMLQLGGDPAMRQRLARAAREKAEAVFAVEDVVDHTFRVYDELLATCLPRQSLEPAALSAFTWCRPLSNRAGRFIRSVGTPIWVNINFLTRMWCFILLRWLMLVRRGRMRLR